MFNDFYEQEIKMFESKTLLTILTVIGVPAFIYTYFSDLGLAIAQVMHLGNVETWVDPVKTIILAVVAIGSGLFFLIRTGIKTIYSLWEFIDKAKERYFKIKK